MVSTTAARPGSTASYVLGVILGFLGIALVIAYAVAVALALRFVLYRVVAWPTVGPWLVGGLCAALFIGAFIALVRQEPVGNTSGTEDR